MHKCEKVDCKPKIVCTILGKGHITGKNKDEIFIPLIFGKPKVFFLLIRAHE